MTMDERELHRRLKDAVEGAQPDSARLWEAVMEESTYAQKQRNARRTAIVMTVLAFAAATPIAIGLLQSDNGQIANDPTTPPPTDTTATPTPLRLAPARIDTQLNVVFTLPKDWRYSEFEGHRTAVPKALPMPPQDGDTAVIQMTFGDLAPKDGRSETKLAGVPAERIDGARAGWIVAEWPASPLCSVCEDGPITIWWEASTDELWTEHEATFDEIVASIRPLFDGSGRLAEFEEGVLHGRRGMVSSPGTANEAIVTVVDFLDRRMWMDDLEAVLSAEGKQAYDELTLAPDCPTERRLEPIECMPGSVEGVATGYTIIHAEAADANSHEILAEIRYTKRAGDDSTSTVTVRERMFVGPGTALDGEDRAFLIRGVVDEPA